MGAVIWLKPLALVGLLVAGPGQAAQVEDLTEALRLPELAVLMREEGIEDAVDLLPPNPSGDVPDLTISRIEAIFEPKKIETELQSEIADLMPPDQLAEAITFFESPAGVALVELELVARAAISDDDVESLARAEWAARADSDDPQVALIRSFAEVNGLLERNTTATMTARYHFMRGLNEGAGRPVSDDEILAQIWAREPQIRADTEGWLMGYLLLAYGPSKLDDLRAYVAFSKSPPGQALNAALFDGFDVAYGRISYGLGLVTGQASMQQDL